MSMVVINRYLSIDNVVIVLPALMSMAQEDEKKQIANDDNASKAFNTTITILSESNLLQISAQHIKTKKIY